MPWALAWVIRSLMSAQHVVETQPQLVLMLILRSGLRDVSISRTQLKSLQSAALHNPLQVEIVLILSVLLCSARSRTMHAQSVNAQARRLRDVVRRAQQRRIFPSPVEVFDLATPAAINAPLATDNTIRLLMSNSSA